jgi:hypothetical protein
MPTVTIDNTKCTNPKDLVGQTKAQMALIPPAAKIALAEALMDGATKYQPYNWREKGVRASVYLSAAERHMMAYLDGEDNASDSGVHHLGHAMACFAILLDAISLGNVVDDRPTKGKAGELLEAGYKKREAKKVDKGVFKVEPFYNYNLPNLRNPKYI